jgi:hypothetical protein
MNRSFQNDEGFTVHGSLAGWTCSRGWQSRGGRRGGSAHHQPVGAGLHVGAHAAPPVEGRRLRQPAQLHPRPHPPARAVALRRRRRLARARGGVVRLRISVLATLQRRRFRRAGWWHAGVYPAPSLERRYCVPTQGLGLGTCLQQTKTPLVGQGEKRGSPPSAVI